MFVCSFYQLNVVHRSWPLTFMGQDFASDVSFWTAAMVLIASGSCVMPKGNFRVIQLLVHNKTSLLSSWCPSDCLMCQDWWWEFHWKFQKKNFSQKLMKKCFKEIYIYWANLSFLNQQIITQKPALGNPGLLPSSWINLIVSTTVIPLHALCSSPPLHNVQ